jgi:uncharacterized membrane protein YkoI
MGFRRGAHATQGQIMKLRTLALALAALASVPALAAAAAPEARPSRLAGVVSYLESAFPAEVTAIQLDASGDKAPHYHVDIRFPEYGLMKWDVDAETLDIAARDPAPLPSGSATIFEAAARVAAGVPGELTRVELDSSDDVPAHYDVDVRMPQGGTARLKVDSATRQIGWRTPAIAAE